MNDESDQIAAAMVERIRYERARDLLESARELTGLASDATFGEIVEELARLLESPPEKLNFTLPSRP